jgi:hypothetical protein
MKIRYIVPSMALFFTVFFLNLIPAWYIQYMGINEGLYGGIDPHLYAKAVDLYVWNIYLFLLFFLLSYFLSSLVLRPKRIGFSELLVFDSFNFKSLNLTIDVNSFGRKYVYSLNRVKTIFYFGIGGCCFVWVYFFSGGYEKIASFGQDIDQWEYRIIGYDDRSRILIAALEVSRRVILPFSIIYLLGVRQVSSVYPSKRMIYFLLFTLLLAGIMTLDRGPILLFVVLVAYNKYCFTTGNKAIVKLGLLSVVLVIFLGGIITFLQYNVSDFSFSDIFTTGLNFFWHRMILVPSIASIELSYHLFPIGSEKLLLQYSRLGALFGQDYIAIGGANALYVTPCGFIADIWRNFGWTGVSVSSLILGGYFALMDNLVRLSDPLTRLGVSFTIVSLCFFLVFGVFFSQGVFFQLMFLIFIQYVLRNDRKKLAY